jgi:hypothetical protein
MKILLDEGPHILTWNHTGEITVYGPFKSIRAATIWGNTWEKQENFTKWELITDPKISVAKPS